MEFVPPVWEPRATAPALPAGVAHVWRLPVEATAAADHRWRELLEPAERERLGRFVFEADARREAASRGALRRLLGHYLGLAPAAVAFTTAERGKPALAAGVGADPVEFNVSHSGDWVLLAFARGSRVGIDLERWREIEAAKLLEEFFRPEEVAEWRLWPEGERPAAFFRAWTLKEAYLKALGAGLAKPLQSFRVRLAPGAAPALAWCADDPEAPERWQLAQLDVAPGYAAAFATERAVQRVGTYTLVP